MFHPPPVDGASFALFIVLHSVRGERSLLDAYRIVVMPSKKRSDPLMMICLVCATLGSSVPSGCYSSLGVSPRSRRGCVVGVLPCQWLTLARFLHPDVMLPLAPWVGCAKGRSPTHLPSPRRSHASIRIGEVVLSNEK